MHDVYKVEFLSRISIWIPKYIFARYENFWIYCKKIDINKYYSEFYEDHILFQQFLLEKAAIKSYMTVNFKNKNLTGNCLFWFVGRLRAWRKNRHNKSHKIFVNIKSRNYLVWQVFYEKWYYKMLFSIKFWTTFCYFVFFAVIRRVIILYIATCSI